ncbi:MAG TPA: winged helix-turn-helix transcriptional regulator [Candidatus Thermoplasmatota archaeon]|nr:winged helix-turn-helix transcriptional regulator [Candidatus Thermoplasmatota archaeon]
MELDETDLGILRLLHEDARTSFRTLAKELGIATPTVSARVKRLEELGIIRGYRVELAPQALGGAVHVLRLQVRPAGLQKVADVIAGWQGVEELLTLTGGSLLLKVRLRPPGVTMQRLHEAISGQEDVVAYEAWEVWNTRRHQPDVATAGVQVTCHQCQGPIRGEPARSKVGGREHIFCCHFCKKAFQDRHRALSQGAA